MHAAPMYIAETAPYQIRGRLISLKEFFIVLGMVVSRLFSAFFVLSLITKKTKVSQSNCNLWLISGGIDHVVCNIRKNLVVI